MFWFFGHEACGILARRPGIKPAPPALEGEVPLFLFFIFIIIIFLAMPHGMRNLRSPTRDRTCAPALGGQSLNCWTAREVPSYLFYI